MNLIDEVAAVENALGRLRRAEDRFIKKTRKQIERSAQELMQMKKTVSAMLDQEV